MAVLARNEIPAYWPMLAAVVVVIGSTLLVADLSLAVVVEKASVLRLAILWHQQIRLWLAVVFFVGPG